MSTRIKRACVLVTALLMMAWAPSMVAARGGHGGGGGGEGGGGFHGGGGGGEAWHGGGGASHAEGGWTSSRGETRTIAPNENREGQQWNREGQWNGEGQWRGREDGYDHNFGRRFFYAPYVFAYPDFYGFDWDQPYIYYNYDNDYYDSGPYAEEGSEYTAAPTNELAAGIDNFRSGDYQQAMRLANQVVMDNPQNAKSHEVLSLALFALGRYRAAAIEAHYALHFGPAASWSTLFHYYDNLDLYNRQLDALANYVQKHPNSPDGEFLLAYQNLMMGHKDAAARQFAIVLQKAPSDEVARQFVQKLGGAASSHATAPHAVLAQPPAHGTTTAPDGANYR